MPLEGEADLKADALLFHSAPRPGKLEIVATKPLANQRDLALAYSPEVAFPCLAIAADPHSAAIYTARQNLVAVLTNGTAVLGLGAIGPLAAKPVMEGKAVLFKKFAGIDVFDIEVAELNVDKLVDVIVALEPTFGESISRTSRVPNVSRLRRRRRPAWAFPYSTTISTERRSLFPQPSSTRLSSQASGSARSRSSAPAPAQRRSLRSIFSSRSARAGTTSSSAISMGSCTRAATR